MSQNEITRPFAQARFQEIINQQVAIDQENRIAELLRDNNFK